MWSRDKNINDDVVIGIHENGLYKLKGKSNQALVHSINPCELWHRRFAHIHYKALPVVSKMVKGLPDLQIQNEGVCKGCALGKKSRKKFPNNNNRAEGILDIIHSDVYGKMSTPSIRNYLYYATFIDDYSRKTLIYLLKTKDEVFDKFVEFKASVENLIGRNIKVLRTNNGGEYTSNEFKDF